MLLYDKNMIMLRKYSDTNLTPSENEEGKRVALMSHFVFFAVFGCVAACCEKDRESSCIMS